ncbi:MAG: hypothetical protein JWM28_2046 [Chitinophagaceae bacterium]|nr:hypothetical protein [Chitinophagaceae bacterium]
MAKSTNPGTGGDKGYVPSAPPSRPTQPQTPNPSPGKHSHQPSSPPQKPVFTPPPKK